VIGQLLEPIINKDYHPHALMPYTGPCSMLSKIFKWNKYTLMMIKTANDITLNLPPLEETSDPEFEADCCNWRNWLAFVLASIVVGGACWLAVEEGGRLEGLIGTDTLDVYDKWFNMEVSNITFRI